MANRPLTTTVLLFCCLLAGSNLVNAEDYPNRPIQVIVPFAAGANSDLAARAIAETLSKTLGPMIVMNKDGAAGIIGTTAVASASPDGYTLGFSTMGPITAQPHLRDDLRYSRASFDYICQVTEVFVVVSVPSESSHKSFSEILDYARRNPGKLSYGHPGAGSVPHLLMADLSARTGINFTAVPFRGDASALSSVLGGHVDVLVSGDAIALNQSVRPLAVFSEKRLADLPDVPATQELGVGPGLGTPAGLFAPKGLPKAVLEKLRASCATATGTDHVIEAMKRTRQNLRFLDGTAFSKRMEDDAATVAEIIKITGRPQN